jgi:c-di-AMP phosphodiesterase-like protein
MDSPLTSTDWISKNSYAVVIILLIAVLSFMMWPNHTIYVFLALILPVLAGIGTEMLFQTDYYKSLNYQLSRLEKTVIVSSVVGLTGLGMGIFSKPLIDGLEKMMD